MGKVIGIDCNEEMLSLARKHQPTVAERIEDRRVRSPEDRGRADELDLLEHAVLAQEISQSANGRNVDVVDDEKPIRL
ncbi:MAG: hypothetical protein ACK4N5_22940 [Myxococcales bacterium]